MKEVSEYMRIYIEFAVKKFQNKMAYRLEVFLGILSTIINIVVYCCIYKALYGSRTEVDGISFSMVVTGFVISLGLSQAFSMDEMAFEWKVRDGNISSEFLKPVNYRWRMLAENVGESSFKLVFHFLPAVLFSAIVLKMKAPAGIWNILGMVISVILGYLILWEMSVIIQTFCFWILSAWGILTLKNVIVNLLAGIMLPLWFMPEELRKIIHYTPFEAIYFTPIQLYLGELSLNQAFLGMIYQLFWVITLSFLGEFLWRMGVKKLVIQGG